MRLINQACVYVVECKAARSFDVVVGMSGGFAVGHNRSRDDTHQCWIGANVYGRRKDGQVGQASGAGRAYQMPTFKACDAVDERQPRNAWHLL